MKIYTKQEIERVVDLPHLMAEIENGLIHSSQGTVLTAPVSFLHFEKPKGDVHIKSAAMRGDEYYVVKIASGFYDNPKHGLSSSNGVMMLFSQKTGELKAVLLDEGRLTDLRTGLAGAITVKHLAQHPITKIGIIGTGTQAREQLFHLQSVTACRDVIVWGRDIAKARAFALDPYLQAFTIQPVQTIETLTQHCNVIITATSSSKPLLFGHQLQPGTHITAVGADDLGKQELDESVFERADLIVVDSLGQSLSYGDLSHAKNIKLETVIELGKFLDKPQHRPKEWITVADLTGIAIEDLQIAKAIYLKLQS